MFLNLVARYINNAIPTQQNTYSHHKTSVWAQKEDVTFLCVGQHVTRSFHGMIPLLQKHKHLIERVQKSESVHTKPLSPAGYLWGNDRVKKRSCIYI